MGLTVVVWLMVLLTQLAVIALALVLSSMVSSYHSGANKSQQIQLLDLIYTFADTLVKTRIIYILTIISYKELEANHS